MGLRAGRSRPRSFLKGSGPEPGRRDCTASIGDTSVASLIAMSRCSMATRRPSPRWRSLPMAGIWSPAIRTEGSSSGTSPKGGNAAGHRTPLRGSRSRLLARRPDTGLKELGTRRAERSQALGLKLGLRTGPHSKDRRQAVDRRRCCRHGLFLGRTGPGSLRRARRRGAQTHR